MRQHEIKYLLDEKANYYNQEWFIEKDPISIPHLFTLKQDIEIAGFLTAILSWGQRKMILKKARILMENMDMSPFSFVTGASDKELQHLSNFVYRTFNGVDCQYFISALREIYISHGGLETIFTKGLEKGGSVFNALVDFRALFLSYSPMQRTSKHVANVLKGSAAKRLNMFLRWMVRDDGLVDFGLWKGVKASVLMIPLDVHVGRVARNNGLLIRKQDDWKAVEELTMRLREFRPDDPTFYDYALFGMGVFEKDMKN